MTEKERLKYIEERRKQRSIEYGANRPRGTMRAGDSGKKSTSLGFRTYVTVVITGGIFAISLFPSDTATALTQTIKTAIKSEMPQSQMEVVRAYLEQIVQDGEVAPISIETWSKVYPEIAIEDDDKDKDKDKDTTTATTNSNGNDGKMVYYPDVLNAP